MIYKKINTIKKERELVGESKRERESRRERGNMGVCLSVISRAAPPVTHIV